MTMNNQEKQCNICFNSKPLSEFHRCKANPDGLQRRCKQCNVVVCRETSKKFSFKYNKQNGSGVYGLWNKLDNCYDYVGEGQFKGREMKHRNPLPYSSSTPNEVKLHVWFDGFDNVYEFKQLVKCDDKKQRGVLETKYISKLKPRYNNWKVKDKRKRHNEVE